MNKFQTNNCICEHCMLVIIYHILLFKFSALEFKLDMYYH